MVKVSNKKRKFIERNFKQFSIEELSRRTGLKLHVVSEIIEKYRSGKPTPSQAFSLKKLPERLPSWQIVSLITFLFTIIAIILYSPSLKGPFAFDGIRSIHDNPLVHITRISQLIDLIFSPEISRKIGYLSFALNYYIGGLNTFTYHLVNIVIHALNGLVLFLLSYTILSLPLGENERRDDVLLISFLGSLIWLVHPVQTQAVSYIAQRVTSLSSLFFLLSLLCYLKGRINKTSNGVFLFLFSIIFGILALATKQNAATLPLFIILSEFCFFQPRPLKLDRKRVWMTFILGGIFILVAGIYLGPDFVTRIKEGYEMRGWSPTERILTQLRVVIFYLSLLIYPNPSRLNLDHDFPISHSLFSPFTTFLSFLLIISLIILSILLIKRNRLVSYAILWFLGNLVIESSIIPLEMVFEHRLYLPSMGLIILVVALCFHLPGRRWRNLIVSIFIPLILLFSYWTYIRASVWSNQISLWSDAVKKSPNKARPYTNLGSAYIDKGMFDKTIAVCEKALAIDPNNASAYTKLGLAYYGKNRLDKAVEAYQKALLINPTHTMAYINLGLAYAKNGRWDAAIKAYRKALALNPNLTEAYNNLGLAYYNKGKLDEAIKVYRKALLIDPTYEEAYTNLGLAYYSKGKLDKAIEAYEKALALNPDFAEVYPNLGLAYRKKGMLDKAISAYQKALALNPDFVEAYINLGNAYVKKGKLDEAISAYQKALAVNPDFAEAHNNLSIVYYSKKNYKAAILHIDKALALGYKVNTQLLESLKAYR